MSVAWFSSEYFRKFLRDERCDETIDVNDVFLYFQTNFQAKRILLQLVEHLIRFIMGDVDHGVDNTPSRVCFTVEELTSFNNEQFVQHWTKQEQYVSYIESQLSTAQSGNTTTSSVPLLLKLYQVSI